MELFAADIGSNMPSLLPRQTMTGLAPTSEYLAEDYTGTILGVTGSFAVAAAIVMAMRMYVRSKMLRFVGPDDWVMVVATVMAIANFVCFCAGARLHTVGRHWEVRTMQEWATFLKWNFAGSLIVMIGVVLVKISIAFFLMRIVPRKGWHMFLWGSIIFLTCFGLVCSGTLIFSCIPVQASWDMVEAAKPTTKCFSGSTFSRIGLFNSVVNISTDVLFAVLPVPVIWNLQINLRTKISLIFVLSLGFVACAAGIIKARLQSIVLTQVDGLYHDSFSLWNHLELCLGILAASLPSLKPLFAAALEGTRSRLGISNPSRSRRTPAASRTTSGFRRHYDPRSFNDQMDDVDLTDYKSGANTTVIHSPSAASSDDRDEISKSYEVRVTSGDLAGETEQWQTTQSRTGSEERLHLPLHSPQRGILRKVEMMHTSESAR